MLGLLRPHSHGLHCKGVNPAQAEPQKHAAGERAAAFAGDEYVGTGSAFGKSEIAVLLDDELAAQRNHEEDSEPAAHQGKKEDAPVFGVQREAEEDQRRDGENSSGGDRFAGRAGGLDDIVFENGGAAEGAQDADGKDRDGNRSRDGETGAEADVNRNGAEENTEQRTKDYGAKAELSDSFFGSDVRLKFSRRCRGTPLPIRHRVSLPESLAELSSASETGGLYITYLRSLGRLRLRAGPS